MIWIKKTTEMKNTKRRYRGIALLIAMGLTLFLAGCTGASEPAEAATNNASQEDKKSETALQSTSKGEDLIIPLRDISETATFYPVTINNTQLEVLAVKAPDGSIRTAFNTCQACFDSGRGYYVQDNDVLVCQNCGNRFEMSQVEIESGGCNPWPIFDQNKVVDEQAITIPYTYLEEATVIFENWKTKY